MAKWQKTDHFVADFVRRWRTAIAFTAETGKTYYLQQQVKAGMWKARTKLALLDDDKGKKELADLKLRDKEVDHPT